MQVIYLSNKARILQLLHVESFYNNDKKKGIKSYKHFKVLQCQVKETFKTLSIDQS